MSFPQGLFAGLSLEGTVLIERKDANRDFYGSVVSARDILSGRVPPPEAASQLYEVIEVRFPHERINLLKWELNILLSLGRRRSG